MSEETAVVVINWNNHVDTKACVDSIRRSECITKIVLVDNASSEEDLHEIRKIAVDVLIKNDINVGFGRGNNIGIKWALENTACRYFMLLNNDAEVANGAIEVLGSKLKRHHAIGIAAPKIVFAKDRDAIWYGGGSIDWKKGNATIDCFLKPDSNGFANKERDVEFASGCAMMIRRDVLDMIGGFDPRFFMYEEDLEFCIRVIKAGWKIRYAPDAVVFHKVQGSYRSNDEGFIPRLHIDNKRLPFYTKHIVKNKLLTFGRHTTGSRKASFALNFGASWTARMLIFLMRGRWKAVRAIFHGLIEFYKTKNETFINELK